MHQYLNTPFDYNDFSTELLFENNNLYQQEQSQTMNPQDTILMSDPNFLRQHQLLQKETQCLEQKQLKVQNHDPPISVNKIDHQRRFNELQARFRVNHSLNKQASSNKSFSSNRKANQNSSSQELPNKIELPSFTPLVAVSATTTSTTPMPIFVNSQSNSSKQLSLSLPSRTMPIQIQRVSRPNQGQHMDPESYQKQLDCQLEKVDFDDITVAELKDMLRQRGKPAIGKKSILVQRLQEEKELAKNGRNRTNRHSLPLARSYNSVDTQELRPRSFEETTNPYEQYFPVVSSSPVTPVVLPLGSPGSQLNRSIANMYIGSPPTTSRRYSPYSPRSPKPPSIEYSSSVSLPEQQVSPMMDPTRLTPGRFYNNVKSYKPITSSALATPDREEDVNPFDTYYENNNDSPIIQQETSLSNIIDWSDPDLQNTLNIPLYSDDASYSNEQLLALFNSPCNFKLDESVLNKK